MAGNLTYRLFQPNDVAGVLQLWEESSGWGGITEEQFYKWFIETPYGNALLVVAVDEKNRIVGQEVFTPSKICVGGTEKKALRFSSPILAKNFSVKLGSANHPTIEMYKVAMRAAIENNYSLVYAFPARAWLRFTPLFEIPEISNRQSFTGEFDCYSFSINAEIKDDSRSGKKFQVSLASKFEEKYDALWESAKKNFPINCAVARNSKWLKWKLGSHCVLEVNSKDGRELLGYVAIKKDSGLLVDALARTPKDLETTVKIAIKSFCQNGLADETRVNEIKLMKTDALAPIAQKLDFKPTKFKFAFWCYSIDESVQNHLFEPSRWYMMPKD